MTYKYLLGPVSMIHLKSVKYDKEVYLVGDFHTKMKTKENKSNILFEKYLDEFFKSEQGKDKMYDYFLETAFYFPEPIGATPMSSAKKYFYEKGCFSRNPEKIIECRKEYPNVRFHIADIRMSPNYKHSLRTFQYSFLSLHRFTVFLNQFFDVKKDEELVDILQENIEDLEIFKIANTTKKLKKEYLKILKSKPIESQLSKVPEKEKKIIKNIKTDIKNAVLNEKNEKNLENTSKIFKKFSSIKQITLKDIKYMRKKLNMINMFIIRMVAPVMDLYILSRMFKKFDDKKYPEMNNIIIHAGNGHIFHIKYVLKNLFGFKIIEKDGMYNKSIDHIKLNSTDNSKYQKINTKNIKLPLFS